MAKSVKCSEPNCSKVAKKKMAPHDSTTFKAICPDHVAKFEADNPEGWQERILSL